MQIQIIVEQLKELNNKIDKIAEEQKESIEDLKGELLAKYKEISDRLNGTVANDGIIARIARIELVIKALIWTTCILIAATVKGVVDWIRGITGK